MKKLTLKQLRVGVVIVSLILISSVAGFRLGEKQSKGKLLEYRVSRDQPIEKQTIDLSLFWQVWDMLSDKYLIKESLKPQQMVWGAIKGMTAALDDPYTVFLPPKQNKETKEELNGAFEGVGIQLGFKEGILSVVAPLSGMPAEEKGILAGDLILHIKDEKKKVDVDTNGMSLPEAVEIIRGPKGSAVVLTILHDGSSEPLEVEIKRETIVIKSVELEWQREDVAYIKLSRFGGRTETEWEETVLEVLKNKELKGVILDLRNNPGGYLQGAVRYASEFLENGKIVAKQENSSGKIETYSVNHQGKLLNVPLVVLVNKGSASSSEILAGALRDHGRAKLVGEKTFGKGTIQEALDLGGGAGLHVTTAKWLLPQGDWVNETEGITPEFEVSLNLEDKEKDEQLEKALGVVLNR